MFKEILAKPDFPKLEEEILKFWKKEKIFEKCLEKTEGKKTFVFYEGPPTANGRPGIHHVLARSFKDLFPRYHTMKGEYCLRKGGWDTHGLPVELEIEKELNLSGKKQIEKYGIEKFNSKCKESVFRYVEEWQALTDRMGFWINTKDPYITCTNEYIESCWWVLKQFYKKGLLKKDYKVVPYCPRCGTPLSSHEVAQGYEDVEEPSIYVKFKVKDGENTYLLAWTTTPWTLPGNVALAVDKNFRYVKVKHNNEFLIIEWASAKRLGFKVSEARAKGTRESFKDDVVGRPLTGEELVNLEYVPLFDSSPKNDNSHRVVLGDFVTADEGTGIVHTAVMYGVEDFNLGEKYGLPKKHTVDDEGKFKESVKEFAGMFVKDSDPKIIQNLKNREEDGKPVDLIFKKEKYKHSYPFCWRCKGPLLYYAFDTWFIKTTDKKKELIKENNKINWVPEHVKTGRMGNWLETLVDWALSRKRYWGTPLNIWQCDKCEHIECLANREEIKNLGGEVPADLHRPFIDKVVLSCPKCKGRMKREEDVIDVWFDSGAMPLAQWGYPGVEGSKERFKEQFPADYICEAMDQTRGWFFTLLAESTLLYGKSPFKNVISLGLVLDEQGKKMSKSVGNVISPWEVIQKTGVDAIRWYFFSVTTAGNEYRFGVNAVLEVVRRFFLILWNSYKFFITYANLDGWEPHKFKNVSEIIISKYTKDPKSGKWKLPVLDRWILSELNNLIKDVRKYLDNYDTFKATKKIEAFTIDFSTWYIRRSRDRVGPSAYDEKDKDNFYKTAYYVLWQLSRLLAPFVPFLSDYIYKSLTGEPSVHLGTFPEPVAVFKHPVLLENMKRVREIVEKARAKRKEKSIRVRQPLSKLSVRGKPLRENMVELIKDEVNVKGVAFEMNLSDEVEIDDSLTVALKAEGEARELIRKIQALRKKECCRLDAKVSVFAPSWPKDFEDYIKTKTLAKEIRCGKTLKIET